MMRQGVRLAGGKWVGMKMLATGLALLLAVMANAGPAQAASSRARMIAGMTAALSDERHTVIDDMSEAELQGAGCLLSGVAGTIAAYGVGANEVVMVVAGGMLAPSTPAVMGVVMLATVFTSGCAVGAIAAPVVYWGYRHFWDTEEVPVAPAVSSLPPPPSATAPTGKQIN